MKQTPKSEVYHEKMVDYKHYAIILLCISVFSYIGSIISLARQTEKAYAMISLSLALIISSVLFFTLSSSYKRKLTEEQ